MWVYSVDAATIVDNDVGEVACLADQFSICQGCGADACWQCGDCLDVAPADCPGPVGTYDAGSLIGLRVLGNSSAVEVAGNRFHDFFDLGCGVDFVRAAAIYATRTASNAGHIHHNLIERIASDPPMPGVGHGILLMQGAEGWSINHNLVVEPGHCGLCEGDFLYYGGTDNVWSQNTVLGGTIGIGLEWAAGSQARGNLVAGASDVAVSVLTQGTGVPTLDHNIYWPVDSDAIGRWDDGDVLGLDEWRTACGCDAAAAVGDPGVVVDADAPQPTPAPDSIAIDAVPPGREPYNGMAADAGALEAPQVLSATVAADRDDTIEIAFDETVAPPLRGWQACAGVEVVEDAVVRAPMRCELRSDDTIAVVLDATVVGDVVEVRYDGDALSDSAMIGGIVDARVPAFVLPVDGAAPGAVETGTGTGTGTSATTSGTTGGDGTGTGQPSGAGGSGCACATVGGSHQAPPAVFVALLVWSSRRRHEGRDTKLSNASTDTGSVPRARLRHQRRP